MDNMDKVISLIKSGQLNTDTLHETILPLIAKELMVIRATSEKNNQMLSELSGELNAVTHLANVLSDFVITRGLEDELDSFIDEYYERVKEN